MFYDAENGFKYCCKDTTNFWFWQEKRDFLIKKPKDSGVCFTTYQ
jgi:hypothetical protein